MDHLEKIAVLRALQLGDLLCMIPAIRAIKNACPRAAITLVGLPWQQGFAGRFRHYFSGFLPFPGWPGLPEQEVDPAAVARFLLQAQEQQFDLVLQMQGDGTHTNDLCQLMGGRKTAGRRLEGHHCTDEKLFPVMTESEHEILRLMRIAEALDIPLQGTALEFPISATEYAQAHRLMQQLQLQPGQYVCLHPGARDPRRRWPVAHFARMGDALAARGYRVLVTGAEPERSLTRAVTEQMQHRATDLVALAGHTGIGELAALIQHSAGLLSNDTGVSHIAAALEVPSVIIFSPYSDPGRWAPLNQALHTAVPAGKAHDLAYVLEVIESRIPLNTKSHESLRSYSDI